MEIKSPRGLVLGGVGKHVTHVPREMRMSPFCDPQRQQYPLLLSSGKRTRCATAVQAVFFLQQQQSQPRLWPPPPPGLMIEMLKRIGEFHCITVRIHIQSPHTEEE